MPLRGLSPFLSSSSPSLPKELNQLGSDTRRLRAEVSVEFARRRIVHSAYKNHATEAVKSALPSVVPIPRSPSADPPPVLSSTVESSDSAPVTTNQTLIEHDGVPKNISLGLSSNGTNTSEGDSMRAISQDQKLSGEDFVDEVLEDLKSSTVVAQRPFSNVLFSHPSSSVYTPRSFPIAIVAYNRPEYLRRTLTSLSQAHGVDLSLVTVFQVSVVFPLDSFSKQIYPYILLYLSISIYIHLCLML